MSRGLHRESQNAASYLSLLPRDLINYYLTGYVDEIMGSVRSNQVYQEVGRWNVPLTETNPQTVVAEETGGHLVGGHQLSPTGLSFRRDIALIRRNYQRSYGVLLQDYTQLLHLDRGGKIQRQLTLTPKCLRFCYDNDGNIYGITPNIHGLNYYDARGTYLQRSSCVYHPLDVCFDPTTKTLLVISAEDQSVFRFTRSGICQEKLYLNEYLPHCHILCDAQGVIIIFNYISHWLTFYQGDGKFLQRTTQILDADEVSLTNEGSFYFLSRKAQQVFLWA